MWTLFQICHMFAFFLQHFLIFSISSPLFQCFPLADRNNQRPDKSKETEQRSSMESVLRHPKQVIEIPISTDTQKRFEITWEQGQPFFVRASPRTKTGMIQVILEMIRTIWWIRNQGKGFKGGTKTFPLFPKFKKIRDKGFLNAERWKSSVPQET